METVRISSSAQQSGVFTDGSGILGVCLPVVIDVRISAYAVLEANVQVVPETAMKHHGSHHPDPVFNLWGGNRKICPVKAKLRLCEILCFCDFLRAWL